MERPSHVTDLLDRISTSPPSRLRLLDAIAATDAALVRHEIAERPVVFVNEPELIQGVLVTHAGSFEKSEFQQRIMGGAEGSEPGLGNGMLTSSNAMNKQQRVLLNRVFAQPATRRYIVEVATLAREQRDRWAGGTTVELGSALMRLSTRIVARALFSWDLGPEDQRVVDDLELIGNLLGRSASARQASWADPSV